MTLTGYDSEKCDNGVMFRFSFSPLSPLEVGHENWRRGILVFAVSEASSVNGKNLVYNSTDFHEILYLP